MKHSQKGAALFGAFLLLSGCQQFNKLVNGETPRKDPADTARVPVYLDGITSFDFDTVYNVAAVSMVKVKRPADADFWTLNIYEFSYDATAHALHFGKLVAVQNNGETVEDAPAAPTGTLYRVIEYQ